MLSSVLMKHALHSPSPFVSSVLSFDFFFVVSFRYFRVYQDLVVSMTLNHGPLITLIMLCYSLCEALPLKLSYYRLASALFEKDRQQADQRFLSRSAAISARLKVM